MSADVFKTRFGAPVVHLKKDRMFGVNSCSSSETLVTPEMYTSDHGDAMDVDVYTRCDKCKVDYLVEMNPSNTIQATQHCHLHLWWSQPALQLCWSQPAGHLWRSPHEQSLFEGKHR